MDKKKDLFRSVITKLERGVKGRKATDYISRLVRSGNKYGPKIQIALVDGDKVVSSITLNRKEAKNLYSQLTLFMHS